MNTYKYSFVTFKLDTADLQSKCQGRRNYYLEKWLYNYDLNYIPNRERTGKVWYMGYSKRKPFIESEKIDWRWTIRNIKVTKIKHTNALFKVTFKVKLSSKEAFTVGEGLKRLFDQVSYKIVKQG